MGGGRRVFRLAVPVACVVLLVRVRMDGTNATGAQALAPFGRVRRGRGGDATTRRALTFLRWTQWDDGEIPVWTSASPTVWSPQVDPNTFGTAMVLHALARVNGPGVSTIRTRATRFLRAHEEATGHWRFWTPRAGRRIDPDLDVTAVALGALRGAGANVVDAWPRFAPYRDGAGRFLTWVRPQGAVNDVDAVVNANVLWAVGDGPERGAAAALVLDTLRDDPGPSAHPYYDTVLALCYAASRAWQVAPVALAEAPMRVVRVIESRMTAAGDLGSLADTVYGFAALGALGLGYSALASRLRAALGGLQQDDGAWPAAPLWNGPEWPAPRAWWWGSPQVTTALVLEGGMG